MPLNTKEKRLEQYYLGTNWSSNSEKKKSRSGQMGQPVSSPIGWTVDLAFYGLHTSNLRVVEHLRRLFEFRLWLMESSDRDSMFLSKNVPSRYAIL